MKMNSLILEIRKVLLRDKEKLKNSKKTYNHLICLIHGIEDNGKNQRNTAQYINNNTSSCMAKPVSYGAIYPWTCLFPQLRKKKIDLLVSRIKKEIEKASRSGKKISFICHSCGTQIFSEIISDLNIKKLETVIFCGSVINRDYDFNEIFNKNPHAKVINECGVKDLIPSLASSATSKDGLGSTGAIKGFSSLNPSVTDRVHNTFHSSYFRDDFIEKYWIPLFEQNKIVRGEGVKSELWANLHLWLERFNLYLFYQHRYIIFSFIFIFIILQAR